MKLATARRMALALPEAREADHHGKPSFRVRGKIFATVPDEAHLHVMLDSDATHVAVSLAPAACEKLHWGKKLAGVRVRLAMAEPDLVEHLLVTAWRRVAPKRLAAAFDAAREG